jgi:hypothetical protein
MGTCLPIFGALLLLLSLPFEMAFAKDAGVLEISAAEFQFIERVAKNIQKSFPAEKYYYVGLGRSPTPIIAYLQLENLSADHLPATSVKWASRFEWFKPEESENIRAHFERFLPSSAELKGRKILLIDHVESGLGLKKVRSYIRGFFGEKYPLESLGLVFDQHDSDHYSEVIDYKLVYKDEDQIVHFAKERYDSFAAYTEAVVAYETEKLKDVKANPKYELLVRALVEARKKYASCAEVLSPWDTKIGDVLAQPLSK